MLPCIGGANNPYAPIPAVRLNARPASKLPLLTMPPGASPSTKPADRCCTVGAKLECVVRGTVCRYVGRVCMSPPTSCPRVPGVLFPDIRGTTSQLGTLPWTGCRCTRVVNEF